MTLLNDWPERETTCKWCGEKIIYLRDKVDNAGNKVRRSVPRYHNGHCRTMAMKETARAKVKAYQRRQQKKKNGGK